MIGGANMEKLKPCPFCGSEAVETYNTEYGMQIYCSNDECILNELLVFNMSTKKWNTRSLLPTIPNQKENDQ